MQIARYLLLASLAVASGAACSASSFGPPVDGGTIFGDAENASDAAPFVPHEPANHIATVATCPVHFDGGAGDQCTSDTNCTTGQACMCGEMFPGNASVKANQCVPAQCTSDANCGVGGYCSPSIVPLCGASGNSGFYCHTPQDTCDDSSDCHFGSCTWTGQAWGCVAAGCAG